MFEELDAPEGPTGVALISEILDGLPSSLARMCRSEFSPNPTVSDLTRELQILVPRWRKDFGHLDLWRTGPHYPDHDRPRFDFVLVIGTAPSVSCLLDLAKLYLAPLLILRLSTAP